MSVRHFQNVVILASCFLTSKDMVKTPVQTLDLCERWFQKPVQLFVDAFAGDLVQHSIDESLGKHFGRFTFGDAARLKIKEFIRIELPDSGTVRAFDIIRKNFQLRFGVDEAVFAQEQIFIELV